MTRRQSIAARPFAPALFAAAVLSLAGCEMSFGHLAAKASDEWTRSYHLAPGGEIRIGNTNGRVDVTGVDGDTVEVHAERIAHAATEIAAKELLPRITIVEDVKPDRISIETSRIPGMLIGVSYEVRYDVRAPKSAAVSARTTNGEILLTALSGRVDAETTNGAVKGDTLTGALHAQTTNGSITVDLPSVGSEPIELGTTNGTIRLTLPATAKATVSASVTNGGIHFEGVNLDVQEKSRRRLEGRLNGGGTSITLHTTNGGIRIGSRSGAQAAER